jgi:hypothetical protein
LHFSQALNVLHKKKIVWLKLKRKPKQSTKNRGQTYNFYSFPCC